MNMAAAARERHHPGTPPLNPSSTPSHIEPPAAHSPASGLAADPELPPEFDQPSPVHGNDRLLLHRHFRSAFLPARRDIIVSLPPGYHHSRAHYPVLYLQDGQNLFDPDTSYVRGSYWNVQSTSDRLIAEGIVQPLIVVGIYNSGVDRLQEYTPTRDRKLGGGGAGQYGHMLVDELKPWVDAHYRTLSGPAHTGIGGSSLGGLLSLYLGLSLPRVFGRLAVLSPSIWWNGGYMLRFALRARPEPRPRIWLDVGTAEGPGIVAKCDDLNRLLIQAGWRAGADLTYMRALDAAHNEDAWAQRVEFFLRFLFPGQE